MKKKIKLQKSIFIFLTLIISILIITGCSSSQNKTSSKNNIIIKTVGKGEVIKQKEGSTTTLTASPEDGYSFFRWDGDLVSTNSPEKVSNLEKKELTAVFIDKSKKEKGIFKLINSWGNEWGPFGNGSYYITYEAAIKNNIKAYMFEPKTNYKPKAIAKFKIKHSLREDIKINIKNEGKEKSLYVDTIDELYPNNYELKYDFLQKGGDESFPDNNIILDITELLPIENEIILEVENKSNKNGTIENFAVEVYNDYNDSPKKVYNAKKPPVNLPPYEKKNITIKNINIKDSVVNSSKFMGLENYSRDYTLGDLKNYEIEKNNETLNNIVEKYETGLAHLPKEKWKNSLKNGLIKSIGTANIAENKEQTNKSIDNSQSKYCPPVTSQGNEGSCVSWASVYYIQSYYQAKANGWNLSAENKDNIEKNKLMSPDFIYQLINNGGNNGTTYLDNLVMLENVGSSTWKNMTPDDSEYTNWGDTEAWKSAAKYRADYPLYKIKISSYADIEAIKYLLEQGYIMAVSINSNKYDQGKSGYADDKGVWTVDNYNTKVTTHANTLVGYDDNYDGTVNSITIK